MKPMLVTRFLPRPTTSRDKRNAWVPMATGTSTYHTTYGVLLMLCVSLPTPRTRTKHATRTPRTTQATVLPAVAAVR